jgi:hypothetical protein
MPLDAPFHGRIAETKPQEQAAKDLQANLSWHTHLQLHGLGDDAHRLDHPPTQQTLVHPLGCHCLCLQPILPKSPHLKLLPPKSPITRSTSTMTGLTSTPPIATSRSPPHCDHLNTGEGGSWGTPHPGNHLSTTSSRLSPCNRGGLASVGGPL